MTPKQILRKALRRLEEPGVWGQGLRGHSAGTRSLETCCIAEAIEEVSGASPERSQAYELIRRAAGLERCGASLVDWNDAPERTLDDVLKAVRLAKAIAL